MAEERPLQAVLDRIVSGSKKRTDAIIADARSQAEQILKRSADDDRAMKGSALRSAKERAQSGFDQDISSAKLESKKASLEGRRRALDDLKESVIRHLVDLGTEERGKMITGLLDKASSVIPEGTIQCGEADAPFLKGHDRYRIEGKVDPPGGIVVIDPTGERVLDLRIVTLVDLAMESSYEEIESILFGE